MPFRVQTKLIPSGCKTSQAKGDGIIRVSRETKGRKGSGVTLVTGLPLAEPELSALARQLKQRCGSGGTVKNGVIEVQGDQREVVLAELVRLGYQAKKAGG
jgi:translation initiation factor 1